MQVTKLLSALLGESTIAADIALYFQICQEFDLRRRPSPEDIFKLTCLKFTIFPISKQSMGLSRWIKSFIVSAKIYMETMKGALHSMV